MSHIHLVKDNIIDTYHWKGNLNLLNIIMLGLAKELPKHNKTYKNGLTAEQIATYTDTNIDDVIAIIESQKTVLA